MKKTAIAGAVAVVVAGGGVFAGTTIASNKISKLYEKPLSRSMTNYKVIRKDLGLTGGEVEWEGTVLVDPCNTNSGIKIHSVDKVVQGLSGFDVHSNAEISLTDNIDQKLSSDTKTPVVSDMSFRWTGSGSGTIEIPEREFKLPEGSLKLFKSTGKIEFEPLGEGYLFEKIDFQVPEILMKNNSDMKFSMKDITYNVKNSATDYSQLPDDGSAQLKIEKFDIQDEKVEVAVQKIDVFVAQKVKGDKVDVDAGYKIGNINAKSVQNPSATNAFTLEDLNLNLSVQQLDKKAITNLLIAVDQSSKRCIPVQEKADLFGKPILELLKTGIKVQSKDNQVKFSGIPVKANAELTIPAMNIDTSNTKALNSIFAKIPEVMKYHFKVEFDKELLLAIARSIDGVNGNNDASSKVDTTWNQLSQTPGVTVQGTHVTFEQSK